ncbi:hypothetical protein AB0F72_17900 [Actinoplanes sp. NPDC023936]|uniref:hypothetical protein n=1 Tax=Actinoplanes sp. NPDC023936 TaxID=3154910 RepID=UPI0033D60A2F
MRVFRTILGMLLLAIGLPALLAGAALWTVMQHRDPGGAFSAELQKVAAPGYAVVVPDVDRLLRDDAPFTRIGDTQLRLALATTDGPAFVGLAPSAEVEHYLAGVSHTRIDAVDIGTGVLPVTSTRVTGPRAPYGLPGQQAFWTRAGQGTFNLVPGTLTGSHSLVVMSPGGAPVNRLAAVAEVRPSWLDSSTWGLITLGTLLLMASVVVLVWPGRRREIVYVVEPSQVPELMQAIGAPLPFGEGSRAGGSRPGDFRLGGSRQGVSRQGGAHRPRTLADSRPARPPALPEFAWPPKAPGALPAGALPGGALPGGTSPGALAGTPLGSPFGSPLGSPLALPGDTSAAESAAPSPSGVTSPSTASSGVISTGTALLGAGSRTPAPGQPLNLLGETPALSGIQQPATIPARRANRRPAASDDIPEFHATAVGAWVAATAPERARQTEARAAARLREAAARKAAAAETVRPASLPGQSRPDEAKAPQAQPAGKKAKVPAASEARPAAAEAPGLKESRPATLAEAPRQGGAGGRQGSKKQARKNAAQTRTAEPQDVQPHGDQPQSDQAKSPLPVAAQKAAPAEASSKTPVSRIALHTGPAATDWTAIGLTRLVSDRNATPPIPAARTQATPAAKPPTWPPTAKPTSPAPADPTPAAPADPGPAAPTDPTPAAPTDPTPAAPADPGPAAQGEAAPGAPAEPAPASPKDPILPIPSRPVDSPEPPEAHAAGMPPALDLKPAASTHETVTDTPIEADAPVTPGKPEKSGTGKAARKSNPLARAQSRITGKPMSVTPGKTGVVRRAPAAWIKAAESMAARVSEKAADAPRPETTSTEAPRPETGSLAAPLPKGEPSEAQASNPARKPRQSANKARPKPPSTPPQPPAAPPVGGQPPAPQPSATQPAAPPAGAQLAAASPAPAHPAATLPTATPTQNSAAEQRPVQAGAPEQNAPGKRTETAEKAAKPLSYREEAAELLAGTTERRRRRTVAGRPAIDRDRPQS